MSNDGLLPIALIPPALVSKCIKPKTSDSTPLHAGAMYTSRDEGASWKKITKFDEKAAKAAKDQQRRDVKAATEVECGTEKSNTKCQTRFTAGAPA